MGTIEKITNITFKSLELCRGFAVYLGEIRNINKKKNLYKSIIFNEKQKKEIDDFYRLYYGKKISYKWHRLYQSYTGVFNKKYFPEILFSTKLEPKLNDYYLAKLLGDKNLLEMLFEKSKLVRIPNTYISCINNTYSDSQRNIVSKEETMALIENIGEVVVKKSVDTSSGRDVMICYFRNGIDEKSKLTTEEIIDSMGTNFIVQEKICQWVELNNLYPKSLNTFRVVTYIVGESIHTGPLSLRMGRNEAEVDNVHHGGITIGVTEDGYLREAAFSEFKERFHMHPDSKMTFLGYKIGKVKEIISGAKELHQLIPHLKIISWDLSVDYEGNIVLIEMNTIGQSVWFPQMVNGQPMFGENTEYMLELIKE